jgi:hypothetical protein
LKFLRALLNGRRTTAHARPNDIAANAVRECYRTLFANLFTPQLRYKQMPGAKERTAYEAKFSAYGLGEVNERLGRFITILEQETDQSSQTPR